MSQKSSKKELIESMKGLIVSCQTQPDDPIHTEDMVVKMAEAAKWGGAVGIRANTPQQIAAIKAKVDLPIIGICRSSDYGRYGMTIRMYLLHRQWKPAKQYGKPERIS